MITRCDSFCLTCIAFARQFYCVVSVATAGFSQRGATGGAKSQSGGPVNMHATCSRAKHITFHWVGTSCPAPVAAPPVFHSDTLAHDNLQGCGDNLVQYCSTKSTAYKQILSAHFNILN